MTNQFGKLAAVQLCATEDVEQNLTTTELLCSQAVTDGADVVFLPEAFSYIGREAGKREILEPLPKGGPILARLQLLARRLDTQLILGGFHELGEQPDKSFNACVHLDAQGAIVAHYRKIHLFDVALKDGTVLAESKSTQPGTTAVTTELGFSTLGLSVCYDLRFPQLYQRLVDMGATSLTVPSAFTATTGAAHWHALLRARAIECQSYLIAPAQHGQHNAKRTSFGHSVIIDPWGRVLAELADGDGYIVSDFDLEKVHSVRGQLPSLQHRRPIE